MPKFYIQSNQVQVVVDALDAEQAACAAFEWWCKRQTEAMFDDNTEDCQLGNEILVSETGFGSMDAETFATLDILMTWNAESVELR